MKQHLKYPKAEPYTNQHLVKLRELASAYDLVVPRHVSRRMVLELALATGARINELTALRWDDFDANCRWVHIQRATPIKRSASTNFLPHKALVLPFWSDFHKPEAEGLVVAAEDGSELTHHAMTSLLAPIFERVATGRKENGYRGLRYTYARLFLEAGGGLVELHHMLGARDLTATSRSFGHLVPERKGFHFPPVE